MSRNYRIDLKENWTNYRQFYHIRYWRIINCRLWNSRSLLFYCTNYFYRYHKLESPRIASNLGCCCSVIVLMPFVSGSICRHGLEYEHPKGTRANSSYCVFDYFLAYNSVAMETWMLCIVSNLVTTPCLNVRLRSLYHQRLVTIISVPENNSMSRLEKKESRGTQMRFIKALLRTGISVQVCR